MLPSKYDNTKIIEFAQRYGCDIVDKINLSRTKLDRVIIRTRCGHYTTQTINNFMKKKIGLYCEDCMEKILSKIYVGLECANPKCKKIFEPNEKSFLFCSKFCAYSREKNNDVKKKISYKVKEYVLGKEKNNIGITTTTYKDVYSEGSVFFNNLISAHYDFEITNRSCPYNHILKPRNINEQTEQINNKIWLPVSLKCSNSSTDEHYYFTLKRNFANIFVICISKENKKIWIFPPNFLQYKTKLKINKISPNRFDEFVVDSTNVISRLNEYYNTLSTFAVGKNDNLSFGFNEKNLHINVECEYIKKRHEHIKFLNFINPVSNFETYNFIVNGYKIQECVSFICFKTNNQIISIHKKRNGKSVPFEITDCDFYWFHERKNNNFYLVPNYILEKYGFLSSDDCKGKTTLCVEKNQNWLDEYKYDYSTINVEPYTSKLKKTFDTN